MISRREFIKLSAVSPYIFGTGGLLLLSDRAEAFLPLIARFFVGGFVRSQTTRAVVPNVVTRGSSSATSLVGRQVTRNSAATGARVYSKKTTLNGAVATQFGFTAGLSVSVSPRVLARVQEFDAEAIWMRAEALNQFELEVRNDSNLELDEQIAIFLRDVEKDTVTNEMYSGNYLVRPNSVSNYPFQISDLPYDGVVRLSAQSTASELKASPSGNIVVAERNEIEIDY